MHMFMVSLLGRLPQGGISAGLCAFGVAKLLGLRKPQGQARYNPELQSVNQWDCLTGAGHVCGQRAASRRAAPMQAHTSLASPSFSASRRRKATGATKIWNDMRLSGSGAVSEIWLH